MSFHVPMVLFAPGVLTATFRTPHLTTHIDLPPSVLDLLGVRDGREHEQGRPLWDDGLGDRRILLLGKDYLGTDGSLDHGGFVSWNHALRCYSRGQGFADARECENGDREFALGTQARFERFTLLQRAYLGQLIE